MKTNTHNFLLSHIDQEQIFVGNIRKCTKYKHHIDFAFEPYLGDICAENDSFGHIEIEDVPFKSNAILIQFENGRYVDLDCLDSIINRIRISMNVAKNSYDLSHLIMSTSAHGVNSFFVEKESLEPYFQEKQNTETITIHQLKKVVREKKH